VRDDEHFLNAIFDVGRRHAEPAQVTPDERDMIVVERTEIRRVQRTLHVNPTSARTESNAVVSPVWTTLEVRQAAHLDRQVAREVAAKSDGGADSRRIRVDRRSRRNAAHRGRLMVEPGELRPGAHVEEQTAMLDVVARHAQTRVQARVEVARRPSTNRGCAAERRPQE